VPLAHQDGQGGLPLVRRSEQDPDKVMIFVPLGGPVADGAYANGAKGIAVIMYQGTYSSFMNGTYKTFLRLRG